MSKGMIFLILILLAGLAAGGFLAHRMAYSRTEIVKKEIQKQIIEDVSPKDAFAMIEKNSGNPGLIIIDVRTPQEFSTGYIKDAINLDYHSRTFTSELDKLDKNKTYLIYCQRGIRSKKTLTLMKQLGFRGAYNVSGGIVQWGRDGLPIASMISQKISLCD